MNDGQRQKVMMGSAHDRVMLAIHTFNEIMTGPNPLTKEEIRKLYNKRPGVYGFLVNWLEGQ